jgi:carboxymethylenebutenolidase
MKNQITLNGQDGTFAAYIARPEVLPAPAVVVLQELFGVNADIREKCDELAGQLSAESETRRRHRWHRG